MDHLFIKNKYFKWYFDIISNAAIRGAEVIGYTEKHHIIPKAIGGNNDKSNIVRLTAREHFVCHRLIIRFVVEPKHRKSMGWALHRMMYSSTSRHDRYVPTARAFEAARVECIAARKAMPYTRTPEHQARINEANTKRLKGTTFSEETKAKMSASRMGKVSPRKGIKESEETKMKKSATMKRLAKEKALLVRA